jgi:hypothetical protein
MAALVSLTLLQAPALAAGKQSLPDLAEPRTPAEACAVALADLQRLPPPVRPFIRYLHNVSGSEAEWVAASVALNYGASRAQTQTPPAQLAGGHLIRVDLRNYIRDAHDLERIVHVWDSLADQDDYYHVTSLKLVPVSRYRHANGRWYTQDWRPWRVPAPHTRPAHEQLVVLSGSLAPILRADWFSRMALSTLEGGVYYEFRGLEAGKTTLEGYLRSRGVSQADIARLQTGERAILLVSEITGKPRRIDYFQGAGAQPSVASGRVFVTSDTKDANLEVTFHPLYNVLGNQTDAQEVIVEQDRRLEYTLFDGRGRLVRSVPEDVAADHEIRPPHTRQLQPAIGCFRCHGKEGGWRTFGDDLSALLAHDFGQGQGLGPIAELSTRSGDRRSPDAQALDAALRMRALFGGNPADVLRGARDDHATNLFLITGGQRPEAVAAMVSDVYAKLEYDQVSPAVAAAEVGHAGRPFDQVVPRIGLGEDPLIGALRAGKSITRRDWERVYALAAERALRAAPATKPQ